MARKQLSHLDFVNASRILNLPAPGGPSEPIRQQDLDAALNGALEGLSWKDSVVVATSTNINLASPGATLDGQTMVMGDRVLVKAQTNADENGIYVWSGAAVAMTRSTDANVDTELTQAIVTVELGTSQGTTWRQTTFSPEIDTDAIVWVSFGVSAPAASETVAGIAEIATQAETNAGTDNTRIVTPAKLAGVSESVFGPGQQSGFHCG